MMIKSPDKICVRPFPIQKDLILLQHPLPSSLLSESPSRVFVLLEQCQWYAKTLQGNMLPMLLLTHTFQYVAQESLANVQEEHAGTV